MDMKLYPYQEVGVRHLLSGQRRYLADDMGLGKTVQALTAAREAQRGPVTVVCPAAVAPGWHAAHAETRLAGGLTTISYAKLIRTDPKAAPPDVVILDEAHYVKSASAKRTRAALRLARDARLAFLLSGTPMPNGDPRELWPAVKALWPEFPASLGISTKAQWTDKFCKYRETQYGPLVYGVRNKPILLEFLRTIMLRRRWREVAVDLPPIRVDLDYLAPEDVDLTEVEAEAAKPEGPHTSVTRRLLGTAKARLVAERVVYELRAGFYGEIVVLAHHRATLDILAGTMREAGVTLVRVDGSSTAAQREAAVEAFMEGKVPVFLGQMTTAGTGLNLQRAREIVLVEPSWVPGENAQAIKRIHRIGSEAPCRARVFTVPGTLDEQVMRTVKRKLNMIQELEV